MSSSKRPFVVPFIGFKIGKYQFDYELFKEFFEKRDFDLIHSANIKVKVELDKKETMLIVQFHLSGEVGLSCDRCTDEVEYQLDNEYQLIYKFGLEESEDENLIVLHPDAYEVDFADALYELTVISLPSKIAHDEGECNEEMMKAMEKYVVNLNSDEEWEDDEEDEDEDPRSPWDILKDLN